MKTITVITATRAEYGLLKPVIKRLSQNSDLEIRVVVTGAHLSPEFGLTYQEIEQDGINIDRKIEILLSSDTPTSVSKSMGLALIGFADYFAERPCDAVMLLGDRYETLAVALAAMNARIPLIHLYGGETTEGALDEAIRHAITKLSYLHLTSTEEYRKRVIQLGESPDRVCTVGSIGVENAMKMPMISREDLGQEIGFDLSGEFAVMTFHPVTLEENTASEQVKQLLSAFDEFPDIKLLITKANADAGGRIINKLIDQYVETNTDAFAVESLGQLRYMNAIRYCSFVIGNSSSGLIEVPSFKRPTINIGDRQKGRIIADSVINCEPNKESISNAISKARSEEFSYKLETITNPYGDGHTIERISTIVYKFLNNNESDLKKTFYDISFVEEK